MAKVPMVKKSGSTPLFHRYKIGSGCAVSARDTVAFKDGNVKAALLRLNAGAQPGYSAAGNHDFLFHFSLFPSEGCVYEYISNYLAAAYAAAACPATLPVVTACVVELPDMYTLS